MDQKNDLRVIFSENLKFLDKITKRILKKHYLGVIFYINLLY